VADQLYGFDADSVQQIAETVRAVHEGGLVSPAQPHTHYDSAAQSVEVVRVTGTSTTNGEYPGILQRIDPSTSPPSFIDTSTEVWVVGPNGEMLDAQKYVARMDGDGNTPVKPRFVICGSGGGGGSSMDMVLHVPTAGAANVLVAAKVTSWTDGNPPAATDGADCWVYEINGRPLAAGYYDGIAILAHSDGKEIYAVEKDLSIADTGSTSIAHPDTLEFSASDFVLTQPRAGKVNVVTKGKSITISYCGSDGATHTLTFVDGLLQLKDGA
jgi:hypothetical protein